MEDLEIIGRFNWKYIKIIRYEFHSHVNEKSIKTPQPSEFYEVYFRILDTRFLRGFMYFIDNYPNYRRLVYSFLIRLVNWTIKHKSIQRKLKIKTHQHSLELNNIFHFKSLIDSIQNPEDFYLNLASSRRNDCARIGFYLSEQKDEIIRIWYFEV